MGYLDNEYIVEDYRDVLQQNIRLRRELETLITRLSKEPFACQVRLGMDTLKAALKEIGP